MALFESSLTFTPNYTVVVIRGGGTLARYNTSAALSEQTVINSDDGTEYNATIAVSVVVKSEYLFEQVLTFTPPVQVVVRGGGTLARYNTSAALSEQTVINSDDGSEYSSPIPVSVTYTSDILSGQTISGRARIQFTRTATILGKANLFATHTTTISGLSRISVNTPKTISGEARITITTTQDVVGVAHIALVIPDPSGASQRYRVATEPRIHTTVTDPRLFLALNTPLRTRK